MVSPAVTGSLSGQVMLAGAGVAGVRVKLVNAAGVVLAATTSSGTGGFAFTGLAAGSYQVKYVAPSGDVLETGSQASTLTGLTAPVALSAGQAVTLPPEILLSDPATIKGMVYRHGTGDPAWGTGESGVVVTLLNSAGAVVATTTTSAGWFGIYDLPAGSYQIRYAPPPGDVIEAGGPANATTGLTASFTLAAAVW
jgi:hypothetical protein